MKYARFLNKSKMALRHILYVIGISLFINNSIANESYVIAIIRDGSSVFFDNLEQRVRNELTILLGSEKSIRYETEGYNANWNLEKIEELVIKATHDEQVDVILVLDVIGTIKVVRSEEKFLKPIVGGMIQDGGFRELPFNDQRKSTRPNLTFAISPVRTIRDLKTFRQLGHWETIHIFLDRMIASNIADFEGWIKYIKQETSLNLNIIDVQKNADSVLTQVDSSVKAAYLTPGLRMSTTERKRLIDGLNEKKIPTFSMIGIEEVRMGVLAAQAPEFTTRVSRRIALNLKKVLGGLSPNEITVDLPMEDQLVINDATSRKIDLAIPFDILSTSEQINEDLVVDASKITLQEAIQIAIDKNPGLHSFANSVTIAEEEVNQSRSRLLPQLQGTASYSQIDDDRARVSGGTQPEKNSRVGVALSQLLFDDSVITNYRISKHSEDTAIEDYQDQYLDIILNVQAAYYNYLQSLASYRVAIDNLKRTQHHLSLAEIRHHYGAARRSELFRWETEEAQTKTIYFNSWSEVQTSLNNLNRILGLAPNTAWDPENIVVKNPRDHFMRGRLDKIIINNKKLAQFTDFSTNWAQEHSPKLKSFAHQIQSQKIVFAKEKRSRFLPAISVSLRYDNRVDDHYIGNINSPASRIGDEWTATIGAEIPLFTSGLIKSNIAIAEANLTRQINILKDRQLTVAQRVHIAVNRISSSYPSVESTAVAADRALKALAIVREEYSEGKSGILDLLDAQNQSFSQEQEAIIASYTYLRDVAEFHRAISWFEFGKSEEEIAAMISKITQFIMEK